MPVLYRAVPNRLLNSEATTTAPDSVLLDRVPIHVDSQARAVGIYGCLALFEEGLKSRRSERCLQVVDQFNS